MNFVYYLRLQKKRQIFDHTCGSNCEGYHPASMRYVSKVYLPVRLIILVIATAITTEKELVRLEQQKTSVRGTWIRETVQQYGTHLYSLRSKWSAICVYSCPTYTMIRGVH